MDVGLRLNNDDVTTAAIVSAAPGSGRRGTESDTEQKDCGNAGEFEIVRDHVRYLLEALLFANIIVGASVIRTHAPT
jgi:hypothetical protein